MKFSFTIAVVVLLCVAFAGCIFSPFDDGGLSDEEMDRILNLTVNQTNRTVHVQVNNSIPPVKNNTPANVTPSLNNSLNTSETPPLPELNQTKAPFEWQQPPALERRIRAPQQFVQVPVSNYEQFLQNPRVTMAIGTLDAADKATLLNAITQLENHDTASWSEFDGKDYWDSQEYWTLPLADTRKIWLRRVAFSLFQELHKNVPWSILDYSDAELKYLLSYCVDTLDARPGFISAAPYAHYGCQSYLYKDYAKKVAPELIFEPNPLRTNEISLEIMNSYDFANQRELIDLLVSRLREMNWGHIQSDADYSYLVNGQQHNMATTIDRLYSLKRGGSGWNSIFLGALLRGWNIPVHVGAINGHGSVQFPTEDIGMFSGDWIHGWPNGLPMENSYISNAQFSQIYSLPVCNAQVTIDKVVIERQLQYYSDSVYGKRVYRYFGNDYCALGDSYVSYLVNNATKTVDSECLDGSDPNKGQWYSAFDQSEMDEWTAKLAAHAEERKICG
ncbi:MAG: hypothetical protein V1722_03070 [Candidatus Micrarchaeota archaeon]